MVQAPSTVSALLGMIWLMVKGPAPVAVPPWAAGSSLAAMTCVSVLVVPFGLVTTVVTVSPTLASAGSVVTMGVPPELTASAALTPLGDSGRATAGAEGALASTVKGVPLAVLLLPAASVTVMTGV